MEEPDIPIIPTSPLVDPFVFAKHYTDDPSPSTQTSLVLDSVCEEEGVEETSEFTRAFRSSGVYPTPRRRTEEYEQSKLAQITSVESDSSEITDTETETETETDADHVGTDLDDASDSEVPDLDALDAELSRVDNMIALPDEVIVYVIRFLRLNDVMSLLESSRKFSWIRTNKDIWSHLYTYYDKLLGPLFEDGADVNVWDDEPVVGPLPPNPRMPPPSPELTRDRPVFSSPNSVSSFFFPPSNSSEETSRKAGRTYTTTNLTLHSSIKEPKSSPATQSFLLPSSRLTAAPASPSKDASHRHASFITKNKPASFSSLHVLTDQTKPVSNTPTFPPKNQKHKWVFPKRTVPAGSTSKKGGLSAVSEDSPSIVVSPHSPAPMHRPSFFQHEEPPSPSAGTLNGILQQLTPASTVPSSTSIEKFLNTYFQTTTPSTLIRKLIQRYHVPRKIAPGLSDVDFHVKIERPIRLRVCKLLKSVFEDVHLEWSPLLVSLVKVFINGFIDKNSDLLRMLSKSLLKRFPGGKPILHFSRPILEVVLRNLELSDICRASQVCKMWNEVSSQSAVWHDLFNYYETLTIGGDPKEVSLWEDIRQSPSFESDYAISSAEILSIPGKSPPASPSFPRQNSGDLSSHFLRHSRSSLSTDSLIVSPPSSPAPNYPPPPIPAHARRLDTLPELDPVEPIEFTVTTPTSAPSSRSHSPTTVPLEDIVQSLAITPSSSNPPSPNTSVINVLAQAGSTSPSSSTLNLHEDLDDGHTPMLNRVLKNRASRGHQRTASETTMNMKKISLNQLVESLTPVSTLPDLMDINAFLMTYRTFTTPQHLVRKLLQRYLVPRELFHNMNDSDFKVSIEYPIQLRVCKILKQLIDSHWTDLDALTVTFLKVFVRGIVDKNSPLGPALLRSMNKEGSKTPSVYVGNKEKVTKKFVLTRRLSEMPSGMKLKHFNDVLRNDPLEVAQQLCLIEYQNFKVLKPSEFFQQAWAKANADKSAPNIRASIGRFNEVTKWIVSMVVQQEKLSKRVKTLQKLILIAKHLRDLNNFHTLMAFLAGINDGPIFRLKFTLSSIPENKMKLLEELQSLMNADSNYENYRQQLAMVPSTQPCIPYLGVCLRDLTYYEEGDTTKSSEGGMINFKQSKNVYSVLHYISVHQKIPYPFELNSSLQTQLKDLPTLEDEDHIHRLSLLREPRNAKRSDIL